MVRTIKRINKTTIKILTIKVILCVTFCMTVLCSGNLQAQPTGKDLTGGQDNGATFVFFYNRTYKILFKDYKCNRTQLQKMDLFLREHKHQLLSGNSYLLIKSYLLKEDLQQPRILNRVSVQGSVARAYIKTRSGVGHSHIAFVFDMMSIANDRLVVEYIRGPVPSSANRSIYYTFRNDKRTIRRTVSRYGKLPLDTDQDRIARIMKTEDLSPALLSPAIQQTSDNKKDTLSNPNLLKKSDRTVTGLKGQSCSGYGDQPESAQNQRNEKDQKNQQNISATQEPERQSSEGKRKVFSSSTGRQQYPEGQLSEGKANHLNDQSDSRQSETLLFVPLFGIKTNLLYLGGVTPELKHRKMIPNIELEWYVARHWSVNADGAWVYLHNVSKDQEQWGISYIGIGPRYWFTGDGLHRGIYVGVYGLTGGFDVKLNNISAEGRTGDYRECGLSTGYYLPLTKRWGLEAGLRVGYRKVNGDLYDYDSPHFYYDSSYRQEGLKLTGIRLLLTYRIGKETKPSEKTDRR